MFENIIGNNNVKQELKQAVKLNKFSHSYLFMGKEGIGKKLFAKEFANEILTPKNALKIDLENNPDFTFIKPEGTSIKIEQIRQMQKKIIEAPIRAEKKVYIIDDADLMTREAQNCLLKTLEEPPEFAIIILIGAIESNFLNTIKSRCMIIKFQNISNEDIKKYLKEKYNITNISENMLDIFGGSIGKAENLKEKSELYNIIASLLENIQKLDFIDFLKSADILYKSQDDKNDILDGINVLLLKNSKQDIRFLNCIEIVEDTKKRLNANGNYNMCIDNMLFKIWEEMH